MRFSRRLAAVLAAGSLLLTGCGTSQQGADQAAPAGGADTPVTITLAGYDGKTIELPKRPERIVSDYYSVGALADYGIKPVGVFGYEGTDQAVVGKADLSGVPVLGTNGEISLEKLAALQPDAVIGRGNTEGTGWQWFKEDVNSQLTAVAPFIPVRTLPTVEGSITEYRNIATAIGGQTDTPQIQADDKALVDAKTELAAALGGKELTMLALAPAKETIYTGKGFPQVDLFEQAGATIIGPDRTSESNPWGRLSWENLSQHPADVYLLSAAAAADPSLFKQEFWTIQPAVKSDQIIEWSDKRAYTASGYAAFLSGAAKKLSGYQKLAA